MTKQQLNVRISDLARAQIDGLCIRYGFTKGEAVERAIARLFNENGLTLERCARLRVQNDPRLAPHADVIFYDWPNWDEHIEWLVAAPAVEIFDWAEQVAQDASCQDC